jgi:hypothetical protein
VNINAARRAAGFPEYDPEHDNARADVVRFACEWRLLQQSAGHEDVRVKLAQLGQAVDRYERTR